MTGDTRGPMVCGEPAADRLMRQVEYRNTEQPMTRRQVAVVLHALADHTAIQSALLHHRDSDNEWDYAHSIGRWLHDSADQLECHRKPTGGTVIKPRVVSPGEARLALAAIRGTVWGPFVESLLHTVATEDERIRAAVAKALKEAERRMFGTTDGDLIGGDSDLPAEELRRLLWSPYNDNGESPEDGAPL